jgi:Helix-turn-helix domain
MGHPEPLHEVFMLSLLTESDVAERLQVSLASVRRWRLEKRGPTFVKVGALVRYRPEDLELWITALPTSGDQHGSQPESDNNGLKIQYSSGH